jgi:hypothetical protein
LIHKALPFAGLSLNFYPLLTISEHYVPAMANGNGP